MAANNCVSANKWRLLHCYIYKTVHR